MLVKKRNFVVIAMLKARKGHSVHEKSKKAIRQQEKMKLKREHLGN